MILRTAQRKTDSLLSSTQYCVSSKDLAFNHTFHLTVHVHSQSTRAFPGAVLVKLGMKLARFPIGCPDVLRNQWLPRRGHVDFR
jgi:hypothetical protein